MMMQDIRERYGKWVIFVVVVSFAALIFVDWGMRPGGQVSSKRQYAGKIEGEKIPLDEFAKQIDAQEQRATESGRELSPLDRFQLRQQLWEEYVRDRLLGKVFEKYGFRGTGLEILEHLRRNPPPGAEQEPTFFGPDSQFSLAKYQQWLSNPDVFDNPFMRMMEAQAASRTVPEAQLRRVLLAGSPMTSLELENAVAGQSTRYWGLVVWSAHDSFGIDPTSIPDAEARARFDAQPDSFWLDRSLARAAYVTLPKGASHADSLIARSEADSIAIRARAGESFADLATTYSEDPGSAAQGGELGGFQRKDQWVPEFAAAAWGLDSGAITGPVASAFGYHIIKSLGRKVENGDTLMSLAHILIKVASSPETSDSLQARLERIRTAVKDGKPFAEAAKAVGLQVDTLPPAVEGQAVQLQSGYLPGLSSYLFSEKNEDGVSEVLQNDQAFYLVGEPLVSKAGRSFEFFRDRIKATIAREKGGKAALAHLEGLRPQVEACSAKVECLQKLPKARVAALAGQPAESYVDGYGYAAPAFYSSVAQGSGKLKTWVGPRRIPAGASMIRLDSIQAPAEAELTAGVAAQRTRSRMMRERSLYDGWYQWMRSSAKVESDLDRFYRD